RERVGGAGQVRLLLHAALADDGDLAGEHAHFGGVGAVEGAAGGEEEQRHELARQHGHSFTSKRRSSVFRSRGFIPPSPSEGRTISRVPLSASAMRRPTMFSLPTPRSAWFSSSVPCASASFTSRSPSAAFLRR